MLQFHYMLNGFQVGWVMGTTSLKSKLLHKLTATRNYVLYKVFIDLCRSYDALDRERFMEVLMEYVAGLCMERML